MGKFLSRREFLKGLAATGASAAAVGLFHVPAFAEGADKYTPGTYSDTEEYGYSSITVTMTFSADAITDCVIESDGGPNDMLTAERKEAMAKAIVEGQNADVDAVTSCTLVGSVGAIQTAVAKIIAEASGTEFEEPEATPVTGRVPG